MTKVRPCALPAGALLDDYARRGTYTDCFAIEIARPVTQSEFVAAFYTTAVFKLERWLLARLISRPSTDAEARQLAAGAKGAFAAWTVEQRSPDQILLAAGSTRSWLMAAPAESGGQVTRLYFGSAIVPVKSAGSTRPRMGWQFRALLGFHKLYSHVLLAAACRKLATTPKAL